MNKSTKLMIAGAAFAGLCSGAYATQVPTGSNGSQATVKTTLNAGVNLLAADKGTHDCKGKNDCKGQGGCKSSDNGCKGKNDCKGKGGCKSK